MTIIGILDVKFTSKDGNLVTGKSLYLTEPIPSGKGIGCTVEKVFLTSSKIADLDFGLELEQEVEIFYNKYGKAQSLKLIDSDKLDF